MDDILGDRRFAFPYSLLGSAVVASLLLFHAVLRVEQIPNVETSKAW